MTETESTTASLLTAWWQDPLGQNVLAQEQLLFQQYLPYFHGYCQLQVGVAENLFPEMPVPKMQTIMARSGDVAGRSIALPFKCYSIDTVLLSHVLEFSADAHQALREAERILVGDGTLIVTVFNPWSLWGLRRLFTRHKKAPWDGHFYSQSRIKDWLSLLNFDVLETERLMFRPPFSNEKWLKRMSKLDVWGQRLWPVFSGVTVIVATKRTIPLTPVAERWKAKQFFPTGRLITKPVTREKIDGRS
jgi:SAM-dependent methyltransferase